MRRVLGGALLAALAAVGVAGCVRPGTGPAPAAPAAARPVLAAGPSQRLVTPAVTLTRTGHTGVRESVVIGPDGEWAFLPAPGSVRSSVLTYGQLDPARHAALARLLAGREFASDAARDPGDCPAGAVYAVTAGPVSARWTDCDTADRPALRVLLDLVGSVAPF